MSSNEKKIIKAGIGYTIGNYLIRGLSFFSIPIFSRILNPSDYGIYNTFIAYEAIIYIILGLAIHSSYKNAKYKYLEEYGNYVSTTILFIILHTIIWLIVVNLISVLGFSLFGFDRLILNILIIYSFSTAIITCYNSYLSLDYEYKKYIVLSAINAIGNISISILLICTVFDYKRYLGRIIGTLIPTFLIAIYICIILTKKYSKKINFKYLKWGIKYSLPIVPHGISQVILNQFDRIMINDIIGSFEAGIYSFAYNIFSILSVTSNSISTIWGPWFYEQMNKKDYNLIRKMGTTYVLLMFLFCIVVMLISPELIKILGSEDYYDAIYCVVPIIAGGFFSFIYYIPVEIEYYNSKTKFIALGTICVAVLNIILNYIFINKYGYIAAAYTTFVSYFLYFWFHYCIAKKINGKSMFDTKVFVLCSILMIFFNFSILILINNFIVRLIFALIIMIIFIIVEEKNIGIIKRRKT